MRLERIFDLFYLLIFNSFQKGFIGLTTITTVLKYKINQWKKGQEKDKIIIENPVKFCGGLDAETYSTRSRRVARAASFHFPRIRNRRGCKGSEVANSLPHTIALPQENPWRKLRSLELVQLARSGRAPQAKARPGVGTRNSKQPGGTQNAGPVGCDMEIARSRRCSDGDWMIWMIFAKPLQTEWLLQDSRAP